MGDDLISRKAAIEALFAAVSKDPMPSVGRVEKALLAVPAVQTMTPLIKAATALRDQIRAWNDGGPTATPEESRVLFEALDAALKDLEVPHG